LNILRRLPLPRLLLLCGLVVTIGATATALASALGSGPVPRPEPLAVAVHDALTAPAVEGVSASVTLSDHLLEGASLSGTGEAGRLASSPLLAGASGRLWIAGDGRLRLELQADGGDTQVLYDGHTISIYEASSNTLYRYTPPAARGVAAESQKSAAGHAPPSLGKVEEAISHLERHADLSAAEPTDVAGQPAYTVRLSPNEGGSLLGAAELSFDAVHGVPLRAALYSSSEASPVIELTADEVSYGPVEASVFSFSPPPDAKVVELSADAGEGGSGAGPGHARPKETTVGHGPGAVAVFEGAAGKGSAPKLPEGLPKVTIDGVSAAELPTQLGTLLAFERAGVPYLLLGSVTPAAIESVARGL
jgi:outer membrane lipoprotein-sorting protein